MKKMKFALVTVSLVAACVFFTGQKSRAEEISIDGSTTVGPIVDAFAEAFGKSDPDLKFSIKKTGSGDGIAALIDGRCQIAMSSRFMKLEEYKNAVEKGVMPVTTTIAMDGVCIIVHPKNTIRELSREQVQKIYLGEVKNWKELGGPDMEIVPISRDTSSGTYEVFFELAMQKKKMASNVEFSNSNPQIFTRVSTTSGAISYVGLGFVKEGVAAVKYEGVTPSRSTIASGKYALSRPLYLFTNGCPAMGSALMKFCDYFLTEEGQSIIQAKGFVPLTNY